MSEPAADGRPAASQPVSAEDQILLDFLAAQRATALAIVEGLDEDAWHRSVVPSGWTPAGLIEHLSGVELHWFQVVVEGAEITPPDGAEIAPYDPLAPFVTDWSSADIIAEYRDLCARSDAVLAVTPLSARPRGKHGDPDVPEPSSVRWVVLHVIEEIARHAGHLDIARELLDGNTRLGQKSSADRNPPAN